jgi:hypothetical protein
MMGAHLRRMSDGFAALLQRGRMDFTVECIVVGPHFSELFSENEIDVARHHSKQSTSALFRPDRSVTSG